MQSCLVSECGRAAIFGEFCVFHAVSQAYRRRQGESQLREAIKNEGENPPARQRRKEKAAPATTTAVIHPVDPTSGAPDYAKEKIRKIIKEKRRRGK